MSGLWFVCMLGSRLVLRTIDMLCFPRWFSGGMVAPCVARWFVCFLPNAGWYSGCLWVITCQALHWCARWPVKQSLRAGRVMRQVSVARLVGYLRFLSDVGNAVRGYFGRRPFVPLRIMLLRLSCERLSRARFRVQGLLGCALTCRGRR